MKIRIYDKFDTNFTCVKYDDVECVIDRDIYFTDGEVVQFDREYEDWEVIEE